MKFSSSRPENPDPGRPEYTTTLLQGYEKQRKSGGVQALDDE
jgi:hypothetical protein